MVQVREGSHPELRIRHGFDHEVLLTRIRQHKPGPGDREVFVAALERVLRSRIPFLVGGAYAFQRYTGIPRHSRDLDLFVREADVPRVMRLFRAPAYRTELTFPHWLGKIYKGRTSIDLIFNSGNGLCVVDDSWFEHATEGEVLDLPVRLCPVEEMIWSKAYIMERERFDGADVLHLLLARAPELDWNRLLARFGPHGPVLLAHFVTFLFVFPSEGWRIPAEVWSRLLRELGDARRATGDAERICRGTLISRSQYLTDALNGFRDARLPPEGGMSHDHLARWTQAAASETRSGIPKPLVHEHAKRLRDQAGGAARPDAENGRRGTAGRSRPRAAPRTASKAPRPRRTVRPGRPAR